MATAKAERLLNLVIALAASAPLPIGGLDQGQGRRVRRRTRPRRRSSAPSSGTSRNCAISGIPLQTPPAGDGLPHPAASSSPCPRCRSPRPSAALALAGRLWETTALAAAGSAGRCRKIPTRSAGTTTGTRSGSTAAGAGSAAAGVTVAPATGPRRAAAAAGAHRRSGVRTDLRRGPGPPSGEFDYRKGSRPGRRTARTVAALGTGVVPGPVVRGRTRRRRGAGAPSGSPGSPAGETTSAAPGPAGSPAGLDLLPECRRPAWNGRPPHGRGDPADPGRAGGRPAPDGTTDTSPASAAPDGGTG